MGISETWITKALKLYSPFPWENLECKEGKQREKSTMKHSKWQSLSATFGALPGVQFMHTYVVSKLGKSRIQRFKRCIIRSWNEGVTAIGSRSYKAEGQFCGLRNHKRMAAKSAIGCKMVSFMLRNFAAILHGCEILLKLPDICDRHFEIFCFRYLMSKSLNSPCNPSIIGFLSL